MPTYDEVMATAYANQAGMNEEELRRRQALIEATVQRDPELARLIASGPYQMRDDLGSTVSSQEAWSRGPNSQPTPTMGASNPLPQTPTPYHPSVGRNTDYPYSGVYNQPSRAGTPSSSGPVVPGVPVSSYNNSYAQSQQGGPLPAYSQGYRAPRNTDQSTADRLRGSYENPFISPGQPNIVINVNGQPQGQAPQQPDWRSADAAMQWSLSQPSMLGGMSVPPQGAQQGPPPYNQSQQYWDSQFGNQAGGQVNPYAPYSLNANPPISQQWADTPPVLRSIRYFNTMGLAGNRP